MRLCLVEDLAVARLEPLTLTRPAHEFLLGATSLGQKIATAFGVGPGPGRLGCIVRNHLVNVLRRATLALRQRPRVAEAGRPGSGQRSLGSPARLPDSDDP